VKRTHSWISE